MVISLTPLSIMKLLEKTPKIVAYDGPYADLCSLGVSDLCFSINFEIEPPLFDDAEVKHKEIFCSTVYILFMLSH